MIVFFLISELNIPSGITYFTDFINLTLFLYMLAFPKWSRQQKDRVLSNSIVIFLFINVIIGVLLNLVNPLLVLWAIRNHFRGIIFWYACVRFLCEEDIEKLFTLFFKFQFVNVIVTLFQFFVQGYSQDYLGGIFGTQVGSNSFTNVYFMLLLTYYCVSYINKKAPFWKLLFIVLSTILIAALAELKIYYFEFAIIIFLAILFSKPSLKNFLISAAATISFFSGLTLLKNIFPLQYKYLTDFERLFSYITMEGGGYNISRLTAFSTINNLFFKDDLVKNLFGFGLGGCEYSSFSFLTSPFYLEYGRLNYRWFTHMMLYLETGFVGFGLFVLFILSCFIMATKMRIGRKNESRLNILVTVQVFSLLTIVNMWYNQALMNENQYFIYFVLSCAFIINKTSLKSISEFETV